MEPREVRRDRSWRAGERARKEHLRIVHPDGVLDCVCERSAWRFAKGAAIEHDCRRRARGNPKVGAGMCGPYGYRPPVIERIRGRRMCSSWLVFWRSEGAPDEPPNLARLYNRK